jgi:uncharacterized membrane protein
MNIFRRVAMVVFALFFIAAGANHFRDSSFYLSIMPPYLPEPYLLVIVSGAAEIILGIALLVPRLTRPAGWGLIALLIAVFPANVHMALHANDYPAIPSALLWLRLPLQGVFMLWAYWYTRRSDRMYAPFRR